MGKDYKIGIVVGLLVLIGGVTYFLVFGGDKTPTTQPAGEQKEKGPNRVVLKGEVPAETTDVAPVETPGGEVADVERSGPVVGGVIEIDETVVEAPKTDKGAVKVGLVEEKKDEILWGFKKPVPTTAPAEKTPKTSETLPIRTVEGKARPPIVIVERDTPTPPADKAPTKPDTPIRIIRRLKPVDLAGRKTYVVQPGDQGFWYVAEKVYGNGKHWKLIAAANPTVDSNRLRPGMVLNIPALPAVTQPGRAVATESEYGKVTTSTTGQKIYIVSKRDTAGLWGIAAKPEIYGKGHLWEHIQKANPTVDPTRLRPGTRLIIPLLAKRTTPGTRPARLRRGAFERARAAQHGKTIVGPDGKRYYVVQSGDAGFWGISKKVYGDGKYSYLIGRANPGITSETLQPGDKLLIPPKPAESTRTTRPVRPAGTTESRPASPAGREDAEPVFE